jgi:hypothetical protein
MNSYENPTQMTTATICHSEPEVSEKYMHAVQVRLFYDPMDVAIDMDTNAPSYPRFVAAVKKSIDRGFDRAAGFGINFNSDYTKYKKYPTHPNTKP